MTLMKLFSWRGICSFAIFLFGVLICHYSGNRGIFPIDSLSHYDSGYRILNGEHPFRDYWIVSGFFIDYVQSAIFFLFGTNWQAYLFNASILNGLISLLIFNLFNKLGLDYRLSFFYAVCFAILAYPSSGTPFVDHHSALLSLVAIIFLILAFEKNKLFYWSLIPIFLFFAFLSKQVPASYILFVVLILIAIHLLHQNKKDVIKILITLFLTSISLVILLMIFFKLVDINLNSFITQYFLYPSTIGEERYKNINYDFKNVFLNFKFIYVALFFLAFVTFKTIKDKNKNLFKNLHFKIFLINTLLFLSFAQHVISTTNQIFIFFLIPLFLGFAHNGLNNLNLSYKKSLSFILIFLTLVTTLKYHYRFNVERKFHELNNVKFSEAINAKELNKKFLGLKWITPDFVNHKDIKTEISFLKRFQEILLLDKTNKIVLTNFSFFSVITEDNVSGYSRWYPGNSSAFPTKENKFVKDLKDLIISIIRKKEIQTIYILPDIGEKNLVNYIDPKCLNRKELESQIIKYEINNKCDDLF